MTGITPETLMAYADGELDPLAAKRVERAIAVDPALAAAVERHRNLRTMLAEQFAPIAAAPVPAALSALLQGAPVADLAVARAARVSSPWRWMTGLAVAASLVLGIAVGQRLGVSAPGAIDQGAVAASGSLARALDTQLASVEGGDGVRVLVSFRDHSGRVCRSFSGRTVSGIACRTEGGWGLRETRMASADINGTYRQAASADADLMADAQGMMAGEPLDAAAEATARARGWH